jgi:protein-S-isoprenylcysteine O-methyltransferase Ste14
MFPFAKVITVTWIVFWLFWFFLAFGSKKNTSLNVGHFTGLRIIIFVLAVGLLRFMGVQYSPFRNQIATNSELIPILGFIMFLLGLLLAIWARFYLGKNWGMPMSQKLNPELVTAGPYHYIRHPIYTGILLAMLGSAIAISLYLLTIFIIIGVYFIYSALSEERLMAQQFPKTYPAYKSKTKMLLPFIF